jgi:hypothetical protein
MQSSLVSKIEKAKRYAEQPNRIKISDFVVDFQGENNNHKVSYESGTWHCSCNFFAQVGTCSHTLALQRLFNEMLPEEAISDIASSNSI